MLGSQQFCVRWNSYQTNLQDVFPKLLNNEHFVDVTLACEAQMIKCHKVVLSACSTYFEQLLVQNPCQHPIIFMKDMKHWEVQALVDFMYKGEVNVSQEEISSLLKAAEALQIRGLCGADRQQDINAVSLPPETTLSDSGGRETPPSKRRKFPESQPERRDKQQPTAPPSKSSSATTAGSSSAATPTSSNNDLAAVLGVSGPITASVTSTPFRETDRNNSSKEIHSEEVLERSNIKREHVEQDESYFENDGDYESFDLQDDSNSMNPDISMPTSPLDQAGPSGMAGLQGSDKAAVWQHLERVLGSTARRGRPKRDDPSLKAAAHLVMDRSFTLRQAALQFQIPPTTLRNYMKRSGMLRMPLKRGRPVSSGSSYHFYSEPFRMPGNFINTGFPRPPNAPQYPTHHQQQYQQLQYQQQHQQQQHPPQQLQPQPHLHQQQQHQQLHQPHPQPYQHPSQQPTQHSGQQLHPVQQQQQQQYGFNSDYNSDFHDFGSEFCDIQELRQPKVENIESSPVEIDLESEPDAELGNREQNENVQVGAEVAGGEGEEEEQDEEGEEEEEEEEEEEDVDGAAQAPAEPAESEQESQEKAVENTETGEEESDSESDSGESD